jgi:hypothetical protein
VFRFSSPEIEFLGEVNAQQRLEDFPDFARRGPYMRPADRRGFYRPGSNRFLNHVLYSDYEIRSIVSESAGRLNPPRLHVLKTSTKASCRQSIPAEERFRAQSPGPPLTKYTPIAEADFHD